VLTLAFHYQFFHSAVMPVFTKQKKETKTDKTGNEMDWKKRKRKMTG